jgi:cytochrome P450
MGSYLQRLDATPPAERWPLVRGWIFNEPLAFEAELRQERPIVVLPELTIAARFDDCCEILRRYETFTVALYKPKQGSYFMAQDDTAVHWREKSIMKAILDREDIPAIRTYIGTKAAALLKAAGNSIDAVPGLTRAVPVALVQDWFGLTHSEPASLIKWSYWNQIDAFWNQPFDAFLWPDPAEVVRTREIVSLELAAYLATRVGLRDVELKAGGTANDSVTRLLELSASKALKFDIERVVQNVGGLLIGAVETTSHTVVNVIDYLMKHPDLYARARAAALTDDPAAVDGYVYEALRFNPAFPYFFRKCEADAPLGRGTPFETTIPNGTTVLALTHSAMFDPAGFSHPDVFDPARPPGNQFHFGVGLHECLGRPIAAVMIPEIVRQALRLDGLTAGPVDTKGGPVPESWQWHWT